MKGFWKSIYPFIYPSLWYIQGYIKIKYPFIYPSQGYMKGFMKIKYPYKGLLFYLFFYSVPRSIVTDSVNARLRSYTTPYTAVYMLYTLRIRPCFGVLHGPVLRSYISVTVYGAIRRKTEVVNGRIWIRIRSFNIAFLRIRS